MTHAIRFHKVGDAREISDGIDHGDADGGRGIGQEVGWPYPFGTTTLASRPGCRSQGGAKTHLAPCPPLAPRVGTRTSRALLAVRQ